MEDNNNNFNIEVNDDDQTSTLPDELLLLIFSFFQYASASSAKLVSKRWRDLWSGVSHRDGSIEELEGTITNFLDNINTCDPSKHPWSLHYRCTSTDHDLTLLEAKVSENWALYLDFFTSQQQQQLQSLPKPTSPWSFHLTLETNKDVNSTPPLPHSKLDPSSFYVKTLHLKSVNYLTSSVVSSVVSSFDHLRNLHIEGCKGLRSLKVSGKELRRLTIFDCLQLKTLRVNAPNLEGFRYRGGRPWFVANGMDGPTTKLVDAMLDFRLGNHSKYIGWKPQLLLSCLMKVKRLTLCRSSYEEIVSSSKHYYNDDWCKMNMKTFKFDDLEDLCWIDDSMDSRRADILLCFLTICPSLKNLQITIDPSCASMFSSLEKRFHRLATTRLQNLKLLEITGSIDHEAESSLVQAISDYAAATELTVIKS